VRDFHDSNVPDVFTSIKITSASESANYSFKGVPDFSIDNLFFYTSLCFVFEYFMATCENSQCVQNLLFISLFVCRPILTHVSIRYISIYRSWYLYSFFSYFIRCKGAGWKRSVNYRWYFKERSIRNFSFSYLTGKFVVLNRGTPLIRYFGLYNIFLRLSYTNLHSRFMRFMNVKASRSVSNWTYASQYFYTTDQRSTNSFRSQKEVNLNLFYVWGYNTSIGSD
jgi:hypothetical protein